MKSSRNLKYKDYFDAVDSEPGRADDQSDDQDEEDGDAEMDDEEDAYDEEDDNDK